jgi:hypothetical protein
LKKGYKVFSLLKDFKQGRWQDLTFSFAAEQVRLLFGLRADDLALTWIKLCDWLVTILTSPGTDSMNSEKY